jgi:hypothetical protein
MRLPLVSHELPHVLAVDNDRYNDYMFILLHRYIEDPIYQRIVDDYDGFKIMDNSCFELGSAVSNKLIFEYFHIIKPDVFVLPDTLGDKEATLTRSLEFLDEYPELAEYAMGVIQGNSIPEFISCYRKFVNVPGLAMIGIPFCFNWAFKAGATPQEHAMCRVKLLNSLERVIERSMKHHLLGTWHAAEFVEYHNYDWVYSVDTSNPVAAGMELTKYEPGFGVSDKPKIKFDEFVSSDVTSEQLDVIMYNIDEFKRMVKRD